MSSTRLRIQDLYHPTFVVPLVKDGIPQVIRTVVYSKAFPNVVSGDDVRRSKVFL